jgi:hypothetical protein
VAFKDIQISDRFKRRSVKSIWVMISVGFFLFGSSLAFVIWKTDWIAQKAREFLAGKIEERAEERNEPLSDWLFTVSTTRNETKSEPTDPNEPAKASETAESLEPLEVKPQADPNETKGNWRSTLSALKDRLADSDDKWKDGLQAVRELDVVQEKTQNLEDQLKVFFEEKTRPLIKKLMDRYLDGEEVNADQTIKMITGLVDEHFPSTAGFSFGNTVKNRLERQKPAINEFQQTVRQDYDEVIRKFIRELKLFSSLNLGLYLIMLIAIRLTGDRAYCIVVPVCLLMLATLIATGIYIFGQDWFNAMIYDRYWGWTYLIWVGVIFVYLIDIVFWDATLTEFTIEIILTVLKITTEILAAFVRIFSG